MRRTVANPEILGGKPIVEGIRLSVEHILGPLAHGMSQSEIVESYPELSIENVTVVVQYAADAPRNDVCFREEAGVGSQHTSMLLR